VADVLANQAAAGTSAFVGPESAIGMNVTTVSTEIHRCAYEEHQRVWESAVSYLQSRLFLEGPDKKLARYALGLSRKYLRVLTGLLTGHVMKIRTDPIFSGCGEEGKTSLHFLEKCPATMDG